MSNLFLEPSEYIFFVFHSLSLNAPPFWPTDKLYLLFLGSGPTTSTKHNHCPTEGTGKESTQSARPDNNAVIQSGKMHVLRYFVTARAPTFWANESQVSVSRSLSCAGRIRCALLAPLVCEAVREAGTKASIFIRNDHYLDLTVGRSAKGNRRDCVKKKMDTNGWAGI